MNYNLEHTKQNLRILAGITGTWIQGGQFSLEQAFRMGSVDTVKTALDEMVRAGELETRISHSFGNPRQVWHRPTTTTLPP